MSDLKREKSILRRLIKCREAIRRKYNLLKQNRARDRKVLNETLKPVLDPLNRLVTLTEAKKLNSILEKRALSRIPKPTREVSVQSFQFNDPNSVNEENPMTEDDSQMEDSPFETAGSADEATSPADFSFAESDDDASKTIVETQNSPTKNYLTMFSDDRGGKDLDKLYGVRKEDGKFVLGRTEIHFDNDGISIKNNRYPKSTGLLELLFKKDPDQNAITSEELNHYKEIMDLTSAHRKHFDENGEIRRHKSKKYDTIISPLFDQIGSGLVPRRKVARPNTSMDYVYWDDPNDLVDRLRFLVAEREAGNNNHINEIFSIIDELREGGYIY